MSGPGEDGSQLRAHQAGSQNSDTHLGSFFLTSERPVSGLFVDSAQPVLNVGLVDFPHPVLRRHLLDPNRDRLLAMIQDAHDLFGDFLSQFLLLLFGFARSEFYDDVRHKLLLSWLIDRFLKADGD
jgi:hypothetical protein